MNDVSAARKREKKINAIIKRAVISLGAGIGFMILLPFLPHISNEQQMLALKGLFFAAALAVIIYGIIIIIANIFVQKHILKFDMLMNWVIVPTYALWFTIETYKILSN